ncbi:hypothetical protein PEX1_009610 [Penicillium expansum]|uniref:Uncharacterized protein n=1 Tax=Penicillium expansum TaxID=27334 RepID=A0A0A2KQ46_PENEN|nr:hypothetical protein PEX2_039910 [Penicillium expansum]KGO38760.1 hypothetical protein PEXP_110380 [Penicillium expansum]KGO54287.1 hypothetical protein PEX2_039910 [Penicillium expansum]KGO66475.1 hypothetical protein PEX1_009610 [Penicillium expansum]
MAKKKKQTNTTRVCTVQGPRIRTMPGHQKPSFRTKTLMNRIQLPDQSFP